jgi:hypothetical protein
MATNTALTPLITQTPGATATYSQTIADTFSWFPIVNSVRPLYARAVYDLATAQGLGQNGFVYADTTSGTVTGSFTTLQVISAGGAQFAGITATNTTVGNLTSQTFPQSFTLNGPILAFKVLAGSVIAYNS